MDAFTFSVLPGPRPASLSAAWIVAAVACCVPLAAALADDPAPAADVPAFQPGEISIGEPIALPFGTPAATGTAGVSAPADDPRATVPTPPAAAAPVPGNGWLGLAVAESTVPGRWRVEEVTPGGPAARAGIVAGDELRSVNGTTLASAEQVSQALTAIAAGQDVRVAVARADRVSDVVLRAEPRPAPRAAEPPAREVASAFVPQAPAPSPVPTSATPPPPAAAAEWRSAPGREEPAPVPRFGRGVDDAQAAGGPRGAPRSAVAPAPFVPPAAAAPTLGGGPATGRTALGVRTIPIDPTTQARFRLAEPTGAYVIGVVQELPAARAGVPPGSVIVALGDAPVRSPLELTRLVETGPVDRPVPVEFVLPGGESKRANVVLQPLDAALERALVAEPTAVVAPPQLRAGPEPRRAERPTRDEAAIRAEIRAIRSRLETLERLLDPVVRRAR